ncbi:DNA cytosine methyltransferase [Streptomyces sp. NBC_00582]|uniref:DNA cytosine methyltransferase n=1 Tax=Streptomyces sp. NBC_00582 TaxID=2975783 RepID=UPI002E8211D8|nr:DNA (cytosine-5-)-methyltransferase [Streptomyces sp. NBC_00582]WUB64322.1 DNA cytosine methyltransferase [Streptomyces sp. NBC_00582]
MSSSDQSLTSIEICAGAGGQAVGLHGAGFRHLALVEIDKHAAATLELNVVERKMWGEREARECQILSMDVKDFNPVQHLAKFVERENRPIRRGELDLLAGGVPCPPFSVAGKQLGQDDERDLFPTMLDLVEELKPRAVMIENVTGLVKPFDKFFTYREQIKQRLRSEGYVVCGWRLLEAADFGVPQLRPRAILVAIREDCYRGFSWPEPNGEFKTVAAALDITMKRRFQKADRLDWYEKWRKKATEAGTVAPTLVGGSKRHGGADLGPTRAKKAWSALGVNGMGVANDEDNVNLDRDLGNGDNLGPMLTVEQAAIIQGFPKDWRFAGRKTAQYRQVGNAFPPPVAEAVGKAIREALERTGDLLEAPGGDIELDGATWESGQGALV